MSGHMRLSNSSKMDWLPKMKGSTINGKIAKPDTVVQNGDFIENVVHRHEPPETSKPVKILHEDQEHGFIVTDKPGSRQVRAPSHETL